VIVYDVKANKLYGLNASGWAPKDLNHRFSAQKGSARHAGKCVHSITFLEQWMDGRKLAEKFGRKKLLRI